MDHNKRDTADVTLDEARRVVDHLSPTDQARLLTYLAPRIAQYVAEMESPAADKADAWNEFFRLGEALMESDTEESGTLTSTVLSMRR